MKTKYDKKKWENFFFKKKNSKKKPQNIQNIFLKKFGVEKEVRNCLLPHLERKIQEGNTYLKKDQKTPKMHDKEALTNNKSAQQKGDEKHQGVREIPRLETLMNKEAHRWQQGNVNKHQECTTKRHRWVIRTHNIKHWWATRVHNKRCWQAPKEHNKEVLPSNKSVRHIKEVSTNIKNAHQGGVD